MKKYFYILILFLSLSGCIYDMYPMYGVMNTGYWVDNKHNKATDKDEISCSGNGLDFYAQCMVQKGYHFYTESFAYCYRFPEECKIYDKYQ